MSETLHIVPVIEAELGELVQLSRSTFIDSFASMNTEEDLRQYLDDNLTLDNLIDEFSNPNTEFYFAKLGLETVGYLKLNTRPAQNELTDENCLELERMYIKKEYQGNNFGASLLSFVLQEAHIQELEFIWLGVWEKNLGARLFYQRHGFEQFSSHEFKLGNDIQTDYLLKKELSANKPRF